MLLFKPTKVIDYKIIRLYIRLNNVFQIVNFIFYFIF